MKTGFKRPTAILVKKGNYVAPRSEGIKRYTLNGLGAPIVTEDFGGIFDDVSAWATTTLNKTLTNLQSQATSTVVKAAQNFVVKITGTDGRVASVTLTPDQAAAYNASGVIPAGLLPSGFVLPPKSFMEEYGNILKMAGVALVATIVLVGAIKMIKKK